MPASNTYDTTNLGSAVSNREDLEQGAYLVSPSISPVWSNANKEKCDNVAPDWTVDTYAAVDTTQIGEGVDSTSFDDEFAEQAKVFNYIGTIKKDAMVTDDQELSNSASGVNFAGAMMKALKELNRNTEAVTLGEQARGISGSTRTTEGISKTLSSSTAIFPTEYQIPTAQAVSATAPTEPTVDNVLRSIQDNCGQPEVMNLYGGTGWISEFAKATMRLGGAADDKVQINLNGETGTIKNKIRIYEGQHGTVNVIDLNSDTVPDTTDKDMAYFIQPNYFGIKELGGLVQKELPDMGGGRRFTLRRKFAPCIKNPRAHGYWSSTSS